MVERTRELGLAYEALRRLRLGRIEGAELLQRDVSLGGGLAREVHHGHAASSDLVEDLVAPNPAPVGRRRSASVDGDISHRSPTVLTLSTLVASL